MNNSSSYPFTFISFRYSGGWNRVPVRPSIGLIDFHLSPWPRLGMHHLSRPSITAHAMLMHAPVLNIYIIRFQLIAHGANFFFKDDDAPLNVLDTVVVLLADIEIIWILVGRATQHCPLDANML